VNLRYRSETCCTRLTENSGRKKSPKNCHLGTLAQFCQAISSQLGHVLTIGKKLVKQQYLLHVSHNMVNFGLLAAELCCRVWGTPANFNWFRILPLLLHCTVVVGMSQTFRRWTEGATYIRQGGHHVGHWPTFLVVILLLANVCFCCVKFSFFSAEPRDWLRRTSSKRPILCRVGCKTVNGSISDCISCRKRDSTGTLS